MVKPEQLAASVWPTDTDTAWESDRQRKTLLKFKDEEEVTPWDDRPGVSAQLWEAMQQLMDILAKLRSPESGWSENLPQTPENLLPYVIEEVYEVSDALKQIPCPSINTDRSPCPSIFSSPSPYILIEELSYRLLWYIARSSYELMQLLGGIDSEILQAKGNWETGILRLVPILEVKTSELCWFLDLVTSQPPQTNLPPQTRVRLAATDCEIEHLKQRLIQHVQVMTPEVKPAIETACVELLEPGKSWQTGEVRLKLDFEFIAGDRHQLTTDPPTTNDLILHFINPALANHYCQDLLLPELTSFIKGMSDIDSQDGDEVRSHLEAIIETATTLVNRCLTAPSHLCFTNKINLNEWLPFLLWQLTSTSYDIMRLLGGVNASILQPEWGWDVGDLRLVGILNVEYANSNLQLDLATGKNLKSSYFGITNDTIIKINDSGLSLEPERVETVANYLIEQIEARSPSLIPLKEGTTIELLAPNHQWQPGFVKLSIDLEFIPGALNY